MRWVSNPAHLKKIKHKIQHGRLLSIDLNINSMSLGLEILKTKPNQETSALDHYYGPFFTLKFRFFRYIGHYNFLVGLIGLALQIYLSVNSYKNSLMTFVWYMVLSVTLVYFIVIWRSKQEEINILLTNPTKSESKNEVYAENIEDRTLFKEQANLKYMNLNVIAKKSSQFLLAKYIIMFIILAIVIFFFFMVIEVLF
jgi:hypothetical protein